MIEAYTEYEITLSAFDSVSYSSCDREARWDGNDQPLISTSFCGDTLPSSSGQYFHTGKVWTSSRNMLVLKARMGAMSGHSSIYAFINSLTVRKAD